jgi:hypothetical protein
MAETADKSATCAGIEVHPAHLGHLAPYARLLDGHAPCDESRHVAQALLGEDAVDVTPFDQLKLSLGLLTSQDRPSR